MDRLEQIKNAVTANGMREWTDEMVSQAMREYADQQNEELGERVKELEAQNKRTKKLLDRYSNYFMLTIDGASPEDTARELKLL